MSIQCETPQAFSLKGYPSVTDIACGTCDACRSARARFWYSGLLTLQKSSPFTAILIRSELAGSIPDDNVSGHLSSIAIPGKAAVMASPKSSDNAYNPTLIFRTVGVMAREEGMIRPLEPALVLVLKCPFEGQPAPSSEPVPPVEVFDTAIDGEGYSATVSTQIETSTLVTSDLKSIVRSLCDYIRRTSGESHEVKDQSSGLFVSFPLLNEVAEWAQFSRRLRANTPLSFKHQIILREYLDRMPTVVSFLEEAIAHHVDTRPNAGPDPLSKYLSQAYEAACDLATPPRPKLFRYHYRRGLVPALSLIVNNASPKH